MVFFFFFFFFFFFSVLVSFFFFFFFFSFLFCPLQRPLFPHMPGPQIPTSPPCLAPQASQVPPPPLPHSWARKYSYVFSFFFPFLLRPLQRPLLPHMPGPQTPTSPPCLAPQASQVPPPPLPHLRARRLRHAYSLSSF